MNHIRTFIALVLAALGIQDDTADSALAPRPVLWSEVTLRPPEKIELAGVVETATRTDHAFRLLGQLVVRNVEVGDMVTRGQMLAAIDSTTFDQAVRSARAALVSARARLANAQSEADRQRALLEKGVTSQAYLDLVVQKLEFAKAEVIRAETALDKAQEQLGFTRITAEHDGVVIATLAEAGETVAPGQPVVVIADTRVLEAVVDLPRNICDCLHAGVRAVVSLDLDPSIRTQGIINEIAPVADSASRTNRARLRLENPPAGFRMGTTVLVRFILPDPPVILLPDSAILATDGNTYVWVADEAGTTLVRRQVVTGERRAGLVEIKSGLEAGERVVVAGVHGLAGHQPIRLGKELVN